MIKLKVYFDYTCPFCYIAESQMKAALQRFPEIEVLWKPFELHPRPTQRKAVIPDPETGLVWEQGLIDAAAAEDLVLGAPHVPLPYTDRAFQGMHFVKTGNDDLWAYNERIFKAVFEEGRNINDIEALTSIAYELDLEGDTFRAALKDGLFARRQEAALRHAYFESGVEELPTFVLGEKRISGAVGREALERFFQNGVLLAARARDRDREKL